MKNYTDLSRLKTFGERYNYLRIGGAVGDATFGFDRYLNQQFYRSREWRRVRNHVISRDNGCDLGIEGYEIYGNLLIHHMNPLLPRQVTHGDPDILDPEFLITTIQQTHNAIHYGDESQLPRSFIERRRGDTQLW